MGSAGDEGCLHVMYFQLGCSEGVQFHHEELDEIKVLAGVGGTV